MATSMDELKWSFQDEMIMERGRKVVKKSGGTIERRGTRDEGRG